LSYTPVIEVGTEPVQSGAETSVLPLRYFRVTVPLTATEELIVTFKSEDAFTGFENPKSKHNTTEMDLANLLLIDRI
jgi:hypothetical protein